MTSQMSPLWKTLTTSEAWLNYKQVILVIWTGRPENQLKHQPYSEYEGLSLHKYWHNLMNLSCQLWIRHTDSIPGYCSGSSKCFADDQGRSRLPATRQGLRPLRRTKQNPDNYFICPQNKVCPNKLIIYNK